MTARIPAPIAAVVLAGCIESPMELTFTSIHDAPEIRVVGVRNFTDDSSREPRTGIHRMRRG